MPTPEARAAFADAHQLLEQLRAVHTREIGLLNAFNLDTTAPNADSLHREIDLARTEWTDTFREYADAIARYVLAVEKSRKEHGAALPPSANLSSG
jgi:hypothetical protein